MRRSALVTLLEGDHLREVLGKAKTIRELLSESKYSIDDYQREYKWEAKQVKELLEDLSTRFLNDYEKGHERIEVEKYGHYFLGSIIISRRGGKNFIVDGQQRLTTLTLLLIHLKKLQERLDGASPVDDLIHSEKYGKKSFNLDVPERTPAMRALFEGKPIDDIPSQESVRNIVSRYYDIEEHLPEDLTGEALPFFTDWLKENVYLVEITAYSEGDAYTIFETMNDRGLSLSPTDMLKGYLVSRITNDEKRREANVRWKEVSDTLLELGKDEPADFLKSWLRSQYAETTRKRKRGASPRDFDRIGTEFHRWVRENRRAIGLRSSSDFHRLIMEDVDFYARQFQRLREASDRIVGGLEEVYYNAQLGFTLQYPVLLAPLTPTDSQEICDQKVRIVATFLDILLTWRIWNARSIAYSTMQYAMFLVMRDIRRMEPDNLTEALGKELDAESETFATNEGLYVHSQNRYKLHRILARITDYVEQSSGLRGRYQEYVMTRGKNRYEVEHIWANKPERHTDEFPHPADFEAYRNRIGGLLLLQRSFNQSYGDLPYEKKLKHYISQNLLAQSLHPDCYERNPGFQRFVNKSGLHFRSHPEFKKADLDARQKLYQKIAERVWDPRGLRWALENSQTAEK